MKILLESRAFYPSTGGLETVSRLLAEEWRTMGHEVVITTRESLADLPELRSLHVVRNPSTGAFLSWVRWSEVFVQSGISLRSLWFGLLARRPVVVIHHAILNPAPGQGGVRAALKVQASRLTVNVAVSHAVAAPLRGSTIVIPNPYRRPPAAVGASTEPRSGLLFVGRLVSDKGCDVAIKALARLRNRGAVMRLTICGDGPERGALERRASELSLQRQIVFRGWTGPDDVALEYTRAEAVVMPSRNEPFGVVALEALAGGCPVVGSAVGGLPEAVGPGGMLVPPDDPAALADAILAMRQPGVRERLIDSVVPHLEAHSIERIAARYLDVLHAAAA